jgi:hypothetical protein
MKYISITLLAKYFLKPLMSARLPSVTSNKNIFETSCKKTQKKKFQIDFDQKHLFTFIYDHFNLTVLGQYISSVIVIKY